MANQTKRYSSEILRRQRALLPVCVVLLLLASLLQKQIDPTARQFHGDTNMEALGGLNSEFLLLPLLGFREAAAGLLWVRCDEFFHSGDYDAILPLVRLITWLDPHAENVYVTGAWHLAYNFTDANERSDRRYIVPSQKLLDEGIINNRTIPDIKFEKGWQNYDKIKNYIVAETAFKSAIAGPHGDETGVKGSDDYPYAAPLKTLHILAHTYEKEGRMPEALDEWNKALVRSLKDQKEHPHEFSAVQMIAAERHNYAEDLQRWHNRYTPDHHDEVNPSPYPAVLEPPPGSANKTPRPWDVVFEPKVDVVRPRVFRISGRFNAADGARIDVRIDDWIVKNHSESNSMTAFEVDPTETILVDSISVRKDRFEREMDMSKDPKMYNFSGDEYRITLSYNPRGTSPHLQDRFGWSGEGLTDSVASHVYIDPRPELMGTKFIEGQGGVGPVWNGTDIPWTQFGQSPRTIRVTYKITRDQVMGQKPITDKDIVPNS